MFPVKRDHMTRATSIGSNSPEMVTVDTSIICRQLGNIVNCFYKVAPYSGDCDR